MTTRRPVDKFPVEAKQPSGTYRLRSPRHGERLTEVVEPQAVSKFVEDDEVMFERGGLPHGCGVVRDVRTEGAHTHYMVRDEIGNVYVLHEDALMTPDQARKTK